MTDLDEAHRVLERYGLTAVSKVAAEMLGAAIETRIERDRLMELAKQQANNREDPHLILALTAQVDRLGERLAFAERLLRGFLSGQRPARAHIEAWEAIVRKQEAA